MLAVSALRVRDAEKEGRGRRGRDAYDMHDMHDMHGVLNIPLGLVSAVLSLLYSLTATR